MNYPHSYATKQTCHNFLVSGNIYKHYTVIMKQVFRIMAIICGFAACYAIWHDLTNIYSASIPLGQLWYSNNPRSLQSAEAIVSRYIDPCSLIAALDCSPFLWHPFISTVLGWPAALVMSGLCVIFYWLSLRMGSYRSRRKTNVRALKRRGEK